MSTQQISSPAAGPEARPRILASRWALLPVVLAGTSMVALDFWISLAVAPLLLTAFVAHQRRRARTGGSTLLDMSLFRERSFSAGLLVQLGFWSGQASFFVVLALYLQQGRGLHPLQAGLVFTILAAADVIASMVASGLALRHSTG